MECLCISTTNFIKKLGVLINLNENIQKKPKKTGRGRQSTALCTNPSVGGFCSSENADPL